MMQQWSSTSTTSLDSKPPKRGPVKKLLVNLQLNFSMHGFNHGAPRGSLLIDLVVNMAGFADGFMPLL